MLKRVIITILLICSTFAVVAVEKGPYLVWNGDNTQMTVLWQFDQTQASSIEWGSTPAYGNTDATVEYGDDHQHRYTITGLTPGTKYYYNVPGVGSGSFTAAPPDDAANVKIFVYGDTRSNSEDHDGVCAGMIGAYTSDPSKQTIAINTGDWVNNGGNESDWTNQFFPRDQANLLTFQSEVQICGPLGNHDGDGVLFNKYFPQPGGVDCYYSFDYGPVHVVIVNQYVSYGPGSVQYNWIESDLAATDKMWKIMAFHEPGFSAGPHPNNTNAQNYLHPLCQQYGVDIVLTGHNHYYLHAVVDDVHHITTGGGGAPLYNPDAGVENVVTSLKTLHFCEISIEGSTLTFIAKRPDGSEIETFDITHTPLSPTVTLTAPSDGAELELGTPVIVAASVNSAGGTCTGVSFYANYGSGDILFGEISAEPWEASWTPSASGIGVTLTATAVIDMGDITETPVSEPVSVNITDPANLPPIANAGEDQTIVDSDDNGSESVTLDGSGSSDPDGSIGSWTWKEGGVTLGTGETVTASFVLGLHTVILEVQDNGGRSDTDTVIVNIQAVSNIEPVADAGPDIFVVDSNDNGSETVTLDGSASQDPDGTIIKYEWDVDNDGTYDLIRYEGEPTVDHDFTLGYHTVTLRVTDNSDATHTDVVTVEVVENGLLYVVSTHVASGNDDSEEDLGDGSIDITSSDLELTYDGLFDRNQAVGIRFIDCNIPKNAEIKKAYIQFTCDETGTGATTVTIRGEAADNAAIFTTTPFDITSRATTTANVSWTIEEWNTVGAATEDERSPDISAIVQEIVNRDGFNEGSALAFIITGSGRRTAESYNGSATGAPLLYVVYTYDGPINQPPTCAITEPIEGATFTAPATVTVTADAADGDGTIANVAFYADATLIGEATTFPYTIDWNDVEAGTYSLTAVATDNDGLSTTSDAVSILVESPADVFSGPELVGRPTATSITLNVVHNQAMDVFIEYGTQPGVYTNQTSIVSSAANVPNETVISSLTPNTKYYYRVNYRTSGTWISRTEHSFHTQPPSGSSFVFSVSADSHFDSDMNNQQLYEITLNNINNDGADFNIDCGDAFLVENRTTVAETRALYLSQRPSFGIFSHSTPLFVVLGNHENEERWNLDDFPNVANSTPVISANARKYYYLNPIPGSGPTPFYRGNEDVSISAIDGGGYIEDYYSFEWGDALFVVLDPFWYTETKPFSGTLGGEEDDETVGDEWDWTLGHDQYEWLKTTLEQSTAKYKFVFTHHLTSGTGTNPNLRRYGRGGAKAAPYYEWGGLNTDGTDGFALNRPGWDKPIHDILVENQVGAVFHGHDHVFAMEELDGIVYQEVPQPADHSYSTGFIENLTNYAGGVIYPNSGHIRVEVTPLQATVSYIRAFLPGDGINGQTAFTYSIGGPVNQPPTCDITSPAPGDPFVSPASCTITATASDEDGSVESVEIYADDLLLGTFTSTPYSAEWTSISAGTYTISAIATDDGGKKDTAEVSITVDLPVDVVSVTQPVQDNNDDAEENLADGSMYLTSSDLELIEDTQLGRTQVVGVRFVGAVIPKDASIKFACIQFTCDEISTGDASLVVHGEAADNPVAYSSTAGDISSRAITTASVSWTPAPWGVIDVASLSHRTPDLKEIVQEIVNREFYNAGSAIAFIISGSGKRTAESYDGVAAAAPRLYVEYSGGAPVVYPTCAITEPIEGATFTSPATVTITADAADGDGTIAGVAFYADATLIGEVTTFPYTFDWNDVEAGTYSLTAVATDNHGLSTTSDAVSILVEPPAGVTIIDQPVAASSDDAEENAREGSRRYGRVTLNSSDLEIIRDGPNDQYVGIRFTGCDIPQGAVIINAYIQFTCKDASNDPLVVTINGEAADDALQFVDDNFNISTRTPTSASVAWDIPEWVASGDAGPAQRTSDLSAVIQEIVNRTGYTPASAFIFIFSGSDGTHNAYSFDEDDPFAPPVLHVEYSLPTFPEITAQPMDQSVSEGETATFSVTATGGNLSYQWQRDGTDIPDATDATYTTAATTMADDGASFTCTISNIAGTVVSDAAVLAVTMRAPVITAQPESQTVIESEAATFSISATGTDLSYQWQRDDVDITDATDVSYTTAATTMADDGASFTCVVSNPAGSVTSDPAILTVTELIAPQIETQPASLTVDEGSTATFTVVATGSFLNYQWQREDSDITGATSSSYTTDPVTMSDNGASFTCVVSNPAGSETSDPAILTVTMLAPVITTQPTDQAADEGETATFTIEATGTDLSYQWQRKDSDISGATSSSYTTGALTMADDDATFRCVVSNDGGTVISNSATLTVTMLAPVITTQPTDQAANEGETATFTVEATGTDLSYQWQREGSDISGATSASYTTGALTMADDDATFRCVVSNDGGTVTSNSAELTVTMLPPVITTQPTDQAANEEETATFTVEATGTDLSYQWQREGSDISGATSASYTTGALTMADDGAEFRCIVSNAGGLVTSNSATLTVNKLFKHTLVSGWNMISFNIHPLDSTVENIFGSLEGLVLVKNSAGEVYWPAYDINTIGSIRTGEAYKVYTTLETTIRQAGKMINVSSTPILLEKGWNMIAYLLQDEKSAESALEGIESEMTLVKNNEGNVYWPEFSINTIGAMKPGQGYKIHMKSDETLTYSQ